MTRLARQGFALEPLVVPRLAGNVVAQDAANVQEEPRPVVPVPSTPPHALVTSTSLLAACHDSCLVPQQTLLALTLLSSVPIDLDIAIPKTHNDRLYGVLGPSLLESERLFFRSSRLCGGAQ